MPSKGSEPGFMRITQFSTYFKEKKKKKLYFRLLIVPVHDFLVLLFTKKKALLTLLVTKCGDSLPHKQQASLQYQLGVLQCNSVLIHSTQKLHQTSQRVPPDWQQMEKPQLRRDRNQWMTTSASWYPLRVLQSLSEGPQQDLASTAARGGPLIYKTLFSSPPLFISLNPSPHCASKNELSHLHSAPKCLPQAQLGRSLSCLS